MSNSKPNDKTATHTKQEQTPDTEQSNLKFAQIIAFLSLTSVLWTIYTALSNRLVVVLLAVNGVVAILLAIWCSLRRRLKPPAFAKRIGTPTLLAIGLIQVAISSIAFVYAFSNSSTGSMAKVDHTPADVLIGRFENDHDADYKVTRTVRTAIQNAMSPYPDAKVLTIDNPLPEENWEEKAHALLKQHNARALIWGDYGVTRKKTRFELHLVLDSIASTASGNGDIFTIFDVPIDKLDEFEVQEALGRNLAQTSLAIMATIHLNNHNLDKALSYFRDALGQTSKTSRSHLAIDPGMPVSIETYIGMIDFIKGDLQSSLQHLRRCLENPDLQQSVSSTARFIEAWDLYYLKNERAARKIFESCVDDKFFGKYIESKHGILTVNIGGFKDLVNLPTVALFQSDAKSAVVSIEIGWRLADKLFDDKLPILKQLAAMEPKKRYITSDMEDNLKALGIVNDFHIMAMALQQDFPNITARFKIDQTDSKHLEILVYVPIGQGISPEDFNALQERIGTNFTLRIERTDADEK